MCEMDGKLSECFPIRVGLRKDVKLPWLFDISMEKMRETKD